MLGGEKTRMEQKPKIDTRSFDLWFYLFAILTLILFVRSQGLSVESAHSLVLMAIVKQMGRQYKDSIESDIRENSDLRIEEKLKELSERVDEIHPYPKQ